MPENMDFVDYSHDERLCKKRLKLSNARVFFPEIYR